jgi:virginiamycin B lyase
MTTSGVASDYAVTPTGSIYQGGITSGPDGALWFSECNNSGNAVGRIPTSGTPISQFGLTTPASNPYGLVTGPDGAVWFTENGTNAIGRIDVHTNTIVEFPLPNPSMMALSPYGIVLGPDGAIWFTECDGNKIGKLQ